MRLLVTGGAGFIGSNFARYWVEQHPEDHVVVYDVLTYAGNRPSLSDIEDRIVFVQGDICDPTAAEKALRGEEIDTIVHFAAESHNSLAVLNPGLFFRTNVLGTQTMLEAARQAGVARFHHVSTCEVYGDLPLDTDEAFHEDSPVPAPHALQRIEGRRRPRGAGLRGDLRAAHHHHQLRQQLRPLPVPREADPALLRAGPRRQGPHAVRQHREPARVAPRLRPLHRHRCRPGAGRVGETYHVGSGVEASIMEVADRILAALGKPDSLKTIVPDRPGHDRRYVLDSSKLRTELGWAPSVEWEQGLAETVAWYAGQPGLVGAARARAPIAEGVLGTPETRLSGADPDHRGRRAAGPRPARLPGGTSACRRPALCACWAPRVPGPGWTTRCWAPTSAHMPVDDRDAVLTTFTAFRPELVLHGGALTAVDRMRDRGRPGLRRERHRHPQRGRGRRIGRRPRGLRLDRLRLRRHVATRPYREWDSPCPTSVYGASKLAGERECRPGSTIVRTSWVCGAHGANMVVTALRLAAAATASCASSTISTARRHSPPTWRRPSSPSASTAGPGSSTSPTAAPPRGGVSCGLCWPRQAPIPSGCSPITTAELDPPRPAPRPANSVLDNMALRLSGLPALPDWQDGLARLVSALRAQHSAA